MNVRNTVSDTISIFCCNTITIYRPPSGRLCSCIIFTANRSPNITVDSVFNVTVRQENTLNVITSDPDGDDVTVTLDSVRPTGADWTNNVYKWTPVDMGPVNISYVSFSVFYLDSFFRFCFRPCY